MMHNAALRSPSKLVKLYERDETGLSSEANLASKTGIHDGPNFPQTKCIAEFGASEIYNDDGSHLDASIEGTDSDEICVLDDTDVLQMHDGNIASASLSTASQACGTARLEAEASIDNNVPILPLVLDEFNCDAMEVVVKNNSLNSEPAQETRDVLCHTASGSCADGNSDKALGSVGSSLMKDSVDKNIVDACTSKKQCSSNSGIVCGKRNREESGSDMDVEVPAKNPARVNSLPSDTNGLVNGRSSESDQLNCDKSVNHASHSTELDSAVKSDATVLPRNLRHLSRCELETLVREQMCEAIASRSVIADLRKSVENLSTAAERFHRKTARLQKQVGDLHLVVKKLSHELKTNTGSRYPIKITRTVGLQVSLVKKSCALKPQKTTASETGGVSGAPTSNCAPSSPNKSSINSIISSLLSPNSKKRREAEPSTTKPGVCGLSPLQSYARAPSLSVGGGVAAQVPSGTATTTTSSAPVARPAVASSRISMDSGRCSADIVDLTDDTTDTSSRSTHSAANNHLSRTTMVNPTASSSLSSSSPSKCANTSSPARSAVHPAPLPIFPANPVVNTGQLPPPPPLLKVVRKVNGIVLSWTMELNTHHAPIVSYHLFAYQEENTNFRVNPWKKVGDVKALPLPMACTLTQFQEGHKYHFAVRAEDSYRRRGPFSRSSSIALAG